MMGLVTRKLWAMALGLLSHESKQQLMAIGATVGKRELERLRADVAGFVRSDPVRGVVLAKGVVRDALERHNVNVTELALEIAVRYLASE